MTPTEQHTCGARMPCLAQAVAFVAAFCQRQGVADDDALRLNLIIEELFTNTVHHGHGGDSDAPIRLQLGVDAESLMLCYEDSAPPFDPVHHLSQASAALDGGVLQRPVGGLGLLLVAHLAQRMDYQALTAGNRLQLALRRRT